MSMASPVATACVASRMSLLIASPLAPPSGAARLAYQPSRLPHEAADRPGRNAGPDLASGNVVHHPGRSGDLGAGPDLEVVGDGRPPTKSRAVPDGHAARNASLGGQNAVSA